MDTTMGVTGSRKKKALLLLIVLWNNVASSFVLPPDGQRRLSCQSTTARSFGSFATRPVSSTSATASSVTTPSFIYTHLEINSMIWQIPEANISLLVDPIASQLDFGISPLYRANKKFLSEQDTYTLIQQAAPTHVLLSQGLDDHTHLATIERLVVMLPDLQFVVCPSAYEKVAHVVPKTKLTVLRHGEQYRMNNQTTVTATVGSLVGPPWQERENGYLLEVQPTTTTDAGKKLSVYYEPHGDTEQPQLQVDNKPIKADICILPVTKQSLPVQLPEFAQFTLVHGARRMQEIVGALEASTVVPLCNGELNMDGALSGLVASSGSVDEFERKVSKRGVRVERPTPGKALKVQVMSSK